MFGDFSILCMKRVNECSGMPKFSQIFKGLSTVFGGQSVVENSQKNERLKDFKPRRGFE